LSTTFNMFYLFFNQFFCYHFFWFQVKGFKSGQFHSRSSTIIDQSSFFLFPAIKFTLAALSINRESVCFWYALFHYFQKHNTRQSTGKMVSNTSRNFIVGLTLS